MSKISRNRCQCGTCLDVIESKTVHDCVYCKCGSIFTDGGLEYIRRGYLYDTSVIIPLDEYEEDDV